MNWTEGSLQRHSRRKGWNEDAARQKQYFAKARARLHQSAIDKSSNNHAASFIPSYIIEASMANAHDSNLSSPQARMKTATSSTRKRLLQLSSDPALEQGNHLSKLAHSSFEGRAGVAKGYQSQRDSGPSDLESKRRRLLEKSDWTGIEFQKPLIIDFPQQRNLLHKQNDAQAHARQSHLYFPNRHDRHHRHELDRPTNKAMKIRIGSHSLRWDRDNNTIRSPASTHRPLPMLQDWKSQHQGSSSLRESSPVGSCGPSPIGSGDPGLRDQAYSHGHPFALKGGQQPEARSIVATDNPQYVIHSTAALHHPQPSCGKRLRLLGTKSPRSQSTDSTAVQVDRSKRRNLGREDISWKSWLGVESGDTTLHPSGYSSDSVKFRPITPSVSQVYSTSDTSAPNHGHMEAMKRAPAFDTVAESSDATTGTHQLNLAVEGDEKRKGQQVDVLSPKRSGSIYQSDRTSNPSPPSQPNNTMELRLDGTGVRDLMLPSKQGLPKPPDVRDLLELLAQEEPASEKSPPGAGSHEHVPSDVDEDEIWKKFVFDDNRDEINQRALDAAREKTRRDLLQPMALTASDVVEPPSSIHDETPTSPAGTDGILSDPLSLPFPASATDMVNTSSALPSDGVSSVAAVQGSTASRKDAPSDFRFHQPRPFVGRLASNGVVRRQPRSPLQRGGGRRRKKRDNHRPDIRALPNFEDDPIETEVE